MKTYPYNRTSIEGRRLFKILDVEFNPGTLNSEYEGQSFESYEVATVMQCRTNDVRFIIPSNSSGVKRPHIVVDADVEVAWGNFTDDIRTLDFTHGQELPLTYAEPLEDDSIKMMIDAGLYEDPRFEELISKLMQDEVCDAEADMNIMYLGINNDKSLIPILLVDPVNVVHDEPNKSEQTTVSNLLKRSARLAVELRKEGVKTEQLVEPTEKEKEIILEESFEDVIRKHTEELDKKISSDFATTSDLLDEEIDVTDELKGSLGFDGTSEDDRIRKLKEQEREESRRFIEEQEELEIEDISEIEDDLEEETKDESVIDFDMDLDDYIHEAEDEGPEF